MIKESETDLICDLAETYGIYDYRALPVTTLAALSVGLREDSRIKMRISGMKVPLQIQLIAAAIDRLSILVWQQTKDGMDGVNRPQSILDMLTDAQSSDTEQSGFESPEEFEAARQEILKRIEG